MDSPDVGSREEMVEPGKRRKILDVSEFSKDKERTTDHGEEWIDTGDRKHRASKSRKSGKVERDSRSAARGKGYGGSDDRVLDGNGEYSEDERSGTGKTKKGERLDTSWDMSEEGRSKRKSSKDRRGAKSEKVLGGDGGVKEESGEKDERPWALGKEERDENERSERDGGHVEVLGTRSSGNHKKKAGGSRAGKVDGNDVEDDRKGGRDLHEESEDERGRKLERDDDERGDRRVKVTSTGIGRSRSRSRGERGHELERELSGDRAAGYEDSEDGRPQERRRSARDKTHGVKTEREEASGRFEGDYDDRVEAAWDEVQDKRLGLSSRNADKVDERGKRGVRDKGRTDRNEILKGDGAEVYKERSKDLDRTDSKWDETEEGKASGRSKRGREEDRRERSRIKERGDVTQDDYEDGMKASARTRDDSRAERQQLKTERADEWAELESGTRSNGRKKVERVADDRNERVRTRDRLEAGREESDDGRRGRADKVDEDWGEKVVAAGREISLEVTEEVGRFSTRPRSEREIERSDKHRERVFRDRAEGSREIAEEGGKALARARGDDERGDKLKGRERADGREESEDGGRSGGRSRSIKNWKESWSPDGKKGGRGDWDDGERDWTEDREELERERPSGRREREKDRYPEREVVLEKDYEDSWERGRRREWEEIGDRRKDRPRERYKDRDDKGRDRESEQDIDRESWDMDRRRERVERERSGRERFEREMNDRERMERERGEGLASPNTAGRLGDVMVRAGPGMALPPSVDPGRGILASGPFMSRMGGESGMLQGEYMMSSGEGDWEAPMLEDRLRLGDGAYLHDNRERFTSEDDPPPGLDQGFGPSPGRGGGNDGGMGFNFHRGSGRVKGSPSNRGRGQGVMHDGRPMFLNNQGGGGGLMMRNMQQGVKGGRGRGPGKGGRGGAGRDNQRGNVPVISQMGPGLPGPHFGPLGPPGPMPGLGPGMMGPGGFQMPPFGAPMGWGGNRGGGDMGMMNGPPGPGPGAGPGPPRFGPGMGPGGPPGPGPNMFFTPPGPGRGGPGAIGPGGMFAGGSPFGGRPIPGDRVPPGGRGAGRGGGPSGRGPSRGEQNDYSQHFVDTGLRPQNFIRDVELADRFEEYPKLKELIARKDKLIADRATPPMYMQCDLRTTELRPEVFGTKFDVILVDPPWEEYVRRAPGVGDSMEWWSYEDIQNLRIEAISDTPAFIFLWVGDAEGLDQGRLCLKKWGFRRCEDICWVKTNRENPTPALRHDSNTLLQHSKEHCLMGIKGTVRRSTDGHIIHANVDTDIIISEEPDYGSTAKPEELYHIIEHFAQGQRRLELFGEDHNIRAGWVTVGKGLSSSNFNPQMYAKHFVDNEGKVWQGGRGNPPVDAPHLVGTTPEIESLRPKSPPPRAQQQPPLQAASATPQTAANTNNKKPPSGTQIGSQNGPPVPIPASGLAHGLSSGASPTVGISRGGSGGGSVQLPKPRTNTSAQGSKPYLISASSAPENVTVKEEQISEADMIEVSGEREGGGIGDQSKTLSS